MVLKLFLLAALAACSPLDTAEQYVTDHGTVYVCDTEQGCGGLDEYCWNGGERELEALLGATCHAETIYERRWPAIAGCAYCCGDGCPRGCDAHCGCACEAAP